MFSTLALSSLSHKVKLNVCRLASVGRGRFCGPNLSKGRLRNDI